MNVLGLDPSMTRTGVAILTDGHPTLMRHTGFAGHRTDSTRTRNRRLRAINAHVAEIIADEHLDLAVIEGPSYGSRFGNPHERGGLWHALYAQLDVRRVPIAVVAPKTRAMWATGNGNADKPEVLAAVRPWWPVSVPNHDVADALVLAAMGALWIGDALPFETKERHANALGNVEWPVMSA